VAAPEDYLDIGAAAEVAEVQALPAVAATAVIQYTVAAVVAALQRTPQMLS
jgi:hypothetical protein